MGVAGFREIIDKTVKLGSTQRRMCDVLKVDRSSIRYEKKPASPLEKYLIELILYLAFKHKRYGYRRITVMIRRVGHPVNHKRVYRLWRSLELILTEKKKRKYKRGNYYRDYFSKKPNDIWCYDFLFKTTEYGKKLKILNVIDEYTRENLAIEVRQSFKSQDVINTLNEIMEQRGHPTYIRSDNGSEFIAGNLRGWLEGQGTTPIFIEPGSPWQNGYVESFNDKFRDECLNMEVMRSRLEAKVIVNKFRDEYNNERPHSSIEYKTPVEFRMECEESSAASLQKIPQEDDQLCLN